MKRIIFAKNDLSTLPISEDGYVTMGVDLDGALKFVDDQGNVSPIVASASGSTLELLSGTSSTPLTQRDKLRFSEYLEVVDDPINNESVAGLSSTALKETNTSRFNVNGSNEVDLRILEKRMLVGDSNGFAIEMTGTEGSVLGFSASNQIVEFQAVEAFNILKETGITGDKQLSLVGIDGISSNLKATFIIEYIMLINTTANSVVINVGSTSGGTDIVNGVTVGANSTVIATLGTRFFSNTSGQNLFISAVSNQWNSSNITISITTKKVHYV